jgi:flagellar biogenesis protein FliO
MVILIIEIVVLAIHFEVENYEFKIFFLYLTLITAVAMVLFLVEGLLVLIRARKSISTSNLLQVT